MPSNNDLTTVVVVCNNSNSEVDTEEDSELIVAIRRRDYAGQECLDPNCNGYLHVHPKHNDLLACSECLSVIPRWLTKREALLKALELGL